MLLWQLRGLSCSCRATLRADMNTLRPTRAFTLPVLIACILCSLHRGIKSLGEVQLNAALAGSPSLLFCVTPAN